MKSDKASSDDIPNKILKQCDFSYVALTKCIKKPINSGSFPDQLKIANIARDAFDKTNYRPRSILLLLSKVYVKVIFKHLSAEAATVGVM